MYIGFQIVSLPGVGIDWSRAEEITSGEKLEDICHAVSARAVAEGLGKDSEALRAIYSFPMYRQFMDQPSTLYVTFPAGDNIYGILNADGDNPKELIQTHLAKQ